MVIDFRPGQVRILAYHAVRLREVLAVPEHALSWPLRHDSRLEQVPLGRHRWPLDRAPTLLGDADFIEEFLGPLLEKLLLNSLLGLRVVLFIEIRFKS